MTLGLSDTTEAFALLLSKTGNVEAKISVEGAAEFEELAQAAGRMFRVRDAAESNVVSRLSRVIANRKVAYKGRY